MTVPSTPRYAGPYYGNGSITLFPFGFKVYSRSDVQFTVSQPGGDPIALVLDADYSVALNVDQEGSPGGTITYPISGSPLAAGGIAAATGELDYSQTVDLPDGGAYRARSVETMGDRLAIQIQQIVDQVSRTLRFPATESAIIALPPSGDRANTQLLFDSQGNPYVAPPQSTSVAGVLLSLASSIGSSLVGFLQAGVGAILRTTQSKLRDNVHLNDFLTDAQRTDVAAGTLTLGCSSALVAARAALPSAGGIIWLPRGKVLLDAVVNVSGTGHVRFIGEGFAEAANNTGATELVKAASLTTAVFNVTAPGTRFEHLVIRGAVGNTGDGVQISANSVSMDNVLVCSMGQDGVRIGLDAGTNANSWHLTNCRLFNNGRYGLFVSDNVSPTMPNASAGTWLNAVAQGNGNDGVRVGNATLNTFFGGVVEGNGGCGIRFNGAGCNYNTVSGTDFDSGNGAGKMRIEAGAVANAVFSATLFDTEIVDNGSQTRRELPSSSNVGWNSTGVFRMQMGNPTGPSDIISGATGYTRIGWGGDAVSGGLTDAASQITIASNGLRLGKSASGMVGFFSVAPVAQATTAIGSASTVANSGTTVNLATTFDGYTLQQIVKALRQYGLLQ